MLLERSAMYERAADIVIETDGLSPGDIAKRITIDVHDVTML